MTFKLGLSLVLLCVVTYLGSLMSGSSTQLFLSILVDQSTNVFKPCEKFECFRLITPCYQLPT